MRKDLLFYYILSLVFCIALLFNNQFNLDRANQLINWLLIVTLGTIINIFALLVFAKSELNAEVEE